MTGTLGIGQISSPSLRPACAAGMASRRVGLGHVAREYLPLVVDANAIPAQARCGIVTAANMFLTRSTSWLGAVFERRRCNCRLKQPVHQFH